MQPAVLFGRGRAHLVTQDETTEVEAHVAARLGLVVDEVDLNHLLLGDPHAALAHLPRGNGRCWLYRGWMLTEEDYEVLYEGIAARGDRLAVTPRQLAEAAYVPSWVDKLEGHTPPTVWTEDDDAGEAWDLAQEMLGPPPWVIKDHLKSARQWWHRACFVPEGADKRTFAEVCQGLLDFREDQFQRGLVVRSFMDLATLPYTTEGRDVVDEHRIFYWKGELVAHAPYYDVDAKPCDPEPFRHLGDVVESPFFSADVARLADGGWTVIELNDGGSSALPVRMDPWALYEAICRDPP